MPRFSLRRFFASTTLITIGVAYMATAIFHGDKTAPTGKYRGRVDVGRQRSVYRRRCL